MKESLIDYTSEREIELFYLSVERGKMGLELMSFCKTEKICYKFYK